MFAPEFENEFNNFMCEADRSQQAWLWVPLRNFANDASTNLNGVISPGVISSSIVVLALLLLIGVGPLFYFLSRFLRNRNEKSVRQAHFEPPTFNPSTNVRLKAFSQQYPTKDDTTSPKSMLDGRPRSVSTEEFEAELEDFWRSILRSGDTRELLVRAKKYLNKNGRYAKAVDELGMRATIQAHLEKLKERQLREVGDFAVPTPNR